jgi:acetylglutamate kinase
MQKAIEKARVLTEALPYIKRFAGQVVVIKYGGSAMVADELKAAVAQDIALLKFVGMKPVIVHGGGKDITKWLERVGKTAQFVNGLRVTDAETMEITEMVLIGKVKKDIMNQLTAFGCKTVGLSGKDGQLIVAKQKSPELGLVGDVVTINTDILKTVMADDYVPVISPIGVGEDGQSYNINADHAASAIAGALQATKLILLTDVAGVLGADKQLIQKVYLDQIPSLIDNGTISGGMIPKVQCCQEALDQGVQSCHIIDGRIEHSILLEIFTDQGIGSMVLRS